MSTSFEDVVKKAGFEDTSEMFIASSTVRAFFDEGPAIMTEDMIADVKKLCSIAVLVGLEASALRRASESARSAAAEVAIQTARGL